jgi:hypothetical protein
MYMARSKRSSRKMMKGGAWWNPLSWGSNNETIAEKTPTNSTDDSSSSLTVDSSTPSSTPVSTTDVAPVAPQKGYMERFTEYLTPNKKTGGKRSKSKGRKTKKTRK